MQWDQYEAELGEYASYAKHFLVSKGIKSLDAEDAVQEAFVKICEMDIEVDAGKLRSYIISAAYHSFINKYRRSKKYAEIMENIGHEIQEAEKTPLELLEEREGDEETKLLEKFLVELSPYDLKMIRLKYYENYSIKDLSAHFGYSASKIKVDLYRARKKLRKMIEDERLRLLLAEGKKGE